MTPKRAVILILTALTVVGALIMTSEGQRRSSAASPDQQRQAMVSTQIAARGIKDPVVIKAMRDVPRHLFVPEGQRAHAYEDRALPVGEQQTISQPYVVALMSELARIEPGAKVLEVGTGSGYQAAVLAEMGAQVFTIEIVTTLAQRARRTLESLGYRSIEYRVGDGYRGWPEAAPFAAILVTAAPDHVPQPLVEQLAIGGRLVLPVGTGVQTLTVITRTGHGTRSERTIPVLFVPMTGEAQQGRR